MGPKKDAKKKKSAKHEEVDEAQYLISEAKRQREIVKQLNELGQLRLTLEKLDVENVDLRNDLRQMERDREDIEAFLRRRLSEKCEEAAELMERNKALIGERTKEAAEFEETMKLKEQKYNEMYDQLSGEIKELNGRLNGLEEYRAQRDVLLDRNNKLESYLQVMEVRALAIEKEYEKANLIDKDRMRKEMEEKLTKFSIDFQKATKARIATATQNVIKENIAINNELMLLIASWQKLHDDNEKMRDTNRYMSNDLATERSVREKIMSKNLAQAEMIDRMAFEHVKLEGIHQEGSQLRRIIQNLQYLLDEKQGIVGEGRQQVTKSLREINDLESKVFELEKDLMTLNRTQQRNASLMKKVQLELMDEPDPLMEKKKASSSNTTGAEELLRRLEDIFSRLAELFAEDWLLDVTGQSIRDASIETAIGLESLRKPTFKTKDDPELGPNASQDTQ